MGCWPSYSRVRMRFNKESYTRIWATELRIFSGNYLGCYTYHILIGFGV